LACTQLLFTLHHQSSHNNQPSTPFLLQFSSGVRHANNLLEVLQAKLPSIPLPAPVTAISLQVKHTQPPKAPASSLFPEPGANPSSQQHVIDQLIARLGQQQVLQAAPLPDHRPEVSNRWQPFQALPPSAKATPTAHPAGPRPLWLL